MRKSTDSNPTVAPGTLAPRGASACGDTPTILRTRGSAGNDAIFGDPPISIPEMDVREPHATTASVVGEIARADAASPSRPTSLRLHHAARAHCSFVLGALVVAAFRAAGAIVRRVHDRLRRRRQARAAYDALRHLDDHMLRDLGFDRSEVTSVAAEVTGVAEHTRVRTLLSSHGLR